MTLCFSKNIIWLYIPSHVSFFLPFCHFFEHNASKKTYMLTSLTSSNSHNVFYTKWQKLTKCIFAHISTHRLWQIECNILIRQFLEYLKTKVFLLVDMLAEPFSRSILMIETYLDGHTVRTNSIKITTITDAKETPHVVMCSRNALIILCFTTLRKGTKSIYIKCQDVVFIKMTYSKYKVSLWSFYTHYLGKFSFLIYTLKLLNTLLCIYGFSVNWLDYSTKFNWLILLLKFGSSISNN